MTSPLWRLDALKYDRSLHYTLPFHLVTDQDGRWHFSARRGDPLKHVTRSFTRPMRVRSEMFFWSDRWYNVYATYDDDQTFTHYYCNISLPPEVDRAARTVTFVDLDLDVRLWVDGRHEVLDEDEFSAHALRYAYPPDVQATARQTVTHLLALWRDGAPPFDGRLRE